MKQSCDFPLPQPIGEHRTFTWGPVVAVHRIGRYDIVEYRPQIFEGSSGTGRYEASRSQFHPYVDGEDTNCGLDTLEQALVFAIATGRWGWAEAFNERFGRHACRLLGIWQSD